MEGAGIAVEGERTWVISRARWRAASAVPYSPSLNLLRSISRSGIADHRRSELVLSVSYLRARERHA